MSIGPAAPGESPSSSTSVPSAGFMLSHPAHLIAFGFGSGLSPVAPGTVGTLWAWLAFHAFQSFTSDGAMAIVIAAGFLLGWWACVVTPRHLKKADPGCIVWDEVIAFWIILWVLRPTGLFTELVAFALFRFFDAAKPGPVGWADRHFKPRAGRGVGGLREAFGIMLDDLVAALCTLLVFAVWRTVA